VRKAALRRQFIQLFSVHAARLHRKAAQTPPVLQRRIGRYAAYRNLRLPCLRRRNFATTR
jgi:hypothetical protein